MGEYVVARRQSGYHLHRPAAECRHLELEAGAGAARCLSCRRDREWFHTTVGLADVGDCGPGHPVAVHRAGV